MISSLLSARELLKTVGCRMSFLKYIFLLCLLVSGLDSVAQIRIIPREHLEATANPRLSADSASLAYDTKHHRAAMSEDDGMAVFRYTFRNTSEQAVEIKRLVTSCSCASAMSSRNRIEAGDTASITVRYNPKGHPGRFERRIFVYTQDGSSPASVLRLSVDVSPASDFSSEYRYQMGTIRLRRTAVAFRKGERGQERIPFVNLGGKAIKLECDRELLADCLSFAVEPSVVEDGNEGEIIISYDPESSSTKTRMFVVLTGLGVAPSRSSVSVTID